MSTRSRSLSPSESHCQLRQNRHGIRYKWPARRLDYQDYDRGRRTASVASDHTFTLDYTELAAQRRKIDSPRGHKSVNILESPLYSHRNGSGYSLPWSSRPGMSFSSFLALSSDSRSSSSSLSTDLPDSELRPTLMDEGAPGKTNSRRKNGPRRFRGIFGWRKRMISRFHKMWKG